MNVGLLSNECGIAVQLPVNVACGILIQALHRRLPLHTFSHNDHATSFFPTFSYNEQPENKTCRDQVIGIESLHDTRHSLSNDSQTQLVFVTTTAFSLNV
jgi:hypothetical protein